MKTERTWLELKAFKALDRLVRENPDLARLRDDLHRPDPVPWWRDNHYGHGRRRRIIIRAEAQAR